MTMPKTLLQMAGVNAQLAQWSDAALVLIDHQLEYVTGGLPLPRASAAVREMGLLLKLARTAGAPVFHIVHHGRPGGALFNPDGQYVRIIPGLEPHDGEHTIAKGLPNAFANTSLNQALKETGRNSIVIAGFATHMCISATARSALDHGYQVTVVADACATRDLPGATGGVVPAEQIHAVTLAALADRFATVVPNAAALTPSFRAA